MAAPYVSTKTLAFSETLDLGGLKFKFPLCAKPENLGRLHGVTHIWMDTHTVYGQRKQPTGNSEMMALYFWRRCGLAGTYIEQGPQDSFLLACLCPMARGTAAQRVFADARLWFPRDAWPARMRMVEEVDETLRATLRQPRAEDSRITEERFHEKTADLLMPKFTAEEKEAYQELCAELFDDIRPILVERGPVAADQLVHKWDLLTRRIGRRSGTKVATRKTAMNVLSYEMRAAVHRCYSAVWNDLIPHLEGKFHLAPESVRFLRLMHLETVRQSNVPESNWHLFHGHIFGLHPGMSMLMLTETGKRLVGEYLLASTPRGQNTSFERLLMAIYASLCFYVCQRQKVQEDKAERIHKKRRGD